MLGLPTNLVNNNLIKRSFCMFKLWTILTKVSTITSKSISVEDAKEVIESLDANEDGQLTMFDLVTLLVSKIKK